MIWFDALKLHFDSIGIAFHMIGQWSIQIKSAFEIWECSTRAPLLPSHIASSKHTQNTICPLSCYYELVKTEITDLILAQHRFCMAFEAPLDKIMHRNVCIK